MSVPTQVSRVQFTGNGSGTTMAFPAIIYFATELVVLGVDPTTNITTTYILNTDYTIDPSDLGSPTGVNVVFGTAPANGILITIARVVPLTQPLELVEGAALPSLPLERQLDEMEFQIQQIQDLLSRVATLPLTTPIGQTVFQRSQDLLVYDTSVGITPQISVTPGNYKDSTGGVDYIPTIGGVAITAIPAPILVVGSTDTQVWAACPINPATGAFSGAPTIASGTSMPSDTETMAYDLISNIIVTVSTIATINVQGGGVSASRCYFYCGLTPTTDGSGHLFNS